MASPSKPDQRLFLPDVPLKQSGEDFIHQLHNVCEELYVRVVMAPDKIRADADDVKHVFADGKATISNSVRTLKKLIDRDILALDDLSFVKGPPPALTARVVLLESYSWTSMCFISYAIGLFVGSGTAVKWAIGPILHWTTALIMMCILPFYVHSRLRKCHWPEDQQRSACFYASMLFGALGAYGSCTPTTFGYFMTVVPLWISLVSGYLEFMNMFRLDYLSYSVGLPYIAYVLYAGMKFERFIRYSAAWTVLCAVIAGDLQLKLGRMKRKWSGKELEQWDSTAVLIATHFVVSQILTFFDWLNI